MEGLGKTEYSVCMRGRDKDNLNDMPYMEEQPVYEIYRVRLPFNRCGMFFVRPVFVWGARCARHTTVLWACVRRKPCVPTPQQARCESHRTQKFKQSSACSTVHENGGSL